jgi:hypothetical protein
MSCATTAPPPWMIRALPHHRFDVALPCEAVPSYRAGAVDLVPAQVQRPKCGSAAVVGHETAIHHACAGEYEVTGSYRVLSTAPASHTALQLVGGFPTWRGWGLCLTCGRHKLSSPSAALFPVQAVAYEACTFDLTRSGQFKYARPSVEISCLLQLIAFSRANRRSA